MHSVLLMTSTSFGFGRHMWDIRLISLNHRADLQLQAFATIYPITVCLVKISILLLYLRIFKVFKSVRLAVYVGSVFIAAFYISYTIAQSILLVNWHWQCDPKDPTTDLALCQKVFFVTIIENAFNVVSDFYVYLIPTPYLLRLPVRKRQKGGLFCIFLAGLIVCIIRMSISPPIPFATPKQRNLPISNPKMCHETLCSRQTANYVKIQEYAIVRMKITVFSTV